MTHTPTRAERHNILVAGPALTNAELHNQVPTGSASGLDRRCITGPAICVSKRTNSLVWWSTGRPGCGWTCASVRAVRRPARARSGSAGNRATTSPRCMHLDAVRDVLQRRSGGALLTRLRRPRLQRRLARCVNVRNLGGIQALFAQARVGHKVIVYR